MACARYREAIQELTDGTLGPIRKAELELHMDQCEDCRALAADLAKIRDVAGSLDRLAPPDRVWLQVAGRLRQEGRVATAPVISRLRLRPVALAIAAALVLMVGTSVVLVLLRFRTAQTPAGTAAVQGNAAAMETVEGVEADMQVADERLQAAATKLDQMIKSNPDAIDPQVASALQKNLQVIDQAIAESRAGLRTDPQSTAAQASLFEALKRKMALLQDTIALVNEMRKGNSTGAAQIVQGSKS